MVCNVVSASAVQERESAICTHILPLPCTASHPGPSHPSGSSQGSELSSLCYAAASHQLLILVHRSVPPPIHPSHPLPPCPVSSLHILISFPALKIASSVPLLSIPHKGINILYCSSIPDLLHLVFLAA